MVSATVTNQVMPPQNTEQPQIDLVTGPKYKYKNKKREKDFMLKTFIKYTKTI